MSLQRNLLGVLGAIALTIASESTALATPMFSTASGLPSAPAAASDAAHASLRVDVTVPKAWVGQAVPITLRAYFRNVEGVTLEGAPQLTSPSVFTSDIAREPQQSTEHIGDESVLVVTWKGTVTPSSAGPLALSAELPVRARYREAAPRIQMESPFGDDPFDAFGADPFDSSLLDRFVEQQMRQPLGRVREEVATLKASARPIDVSALPTADQPASFTGAVGHFNVTASLSAAHAQVSEPVTLRVVATGDGDLDRVDLRGVESSDEWKAYPPKSSVEPAKKGERPKKVFEQVLVPLHAGDLSVPPVSLSSFDPDAAKYVTRSTAALSVSVDGAPLRSSAAPPSNAPEAPVGASTAAPLEPPPPRVVGATRLFYWLAPLPALLAAAFLLSRPRRKRAAKSLLREMRATATRGETIPFYKTARSLIETRLAERWGIEPETVSSSYIRERLGSPGDPLADAVAADEALRFGRAQVQTVSLVPLCDSIERSLAGVS